MSHSDQSEQFLGDYLLDGEPARIVLVGNPPIQIDEKAVSVSPLRIAHLNDVPEPGHSQPTPADKNKSDMTEAIDRSVLVIGLDSLLAKQKTASDTFADQTLGLAIRRFPWRVLAHCSSSLIGDERFYAFGFRRLSVRTREPDSLQGGTVPAAGNPVQDAVPDDISLSRWYEYRLSDYKRAPDWLNARFWANPERFFDSDSDDDFDDTNDETLDEEE